MRGRDLRRHLAGLDQLGNSAGHSCSEQVGAGQAAVAADHDQRVDPAFEQVAGCLAPTLPRAELVAPRGAEDVPPRCRIPPTSADDMRRMASPPSTRPW